MKILYIGNTGIGKTPLVEALKAIDNAELVVVSADFNITPEPFVVKAMKLEPLDMKMTVLEDSKLSARARRRLAERIEAKQQRKDRKRNKRK